MDSEDSSKVGTAAGSLAIRMLAMQEAFADPFQQGNQGCKSINLKCFELLVRLVSQKGLGRVPCSQARSGFRNTQPLQRLQTLSEI